jgi:hypothetical protein
VLPATTKDSETMTEEAAAAPPPTYQCLLTGGLYQQSQSPQPTYYSSLFLPSPGFAGGNEYQGNYTSYMQFWVLLDKNPLNKPQQFVAPDYSTVPSGLAALMNNQHLLACVQSATSNVAPSGALYDFLMANGGGSGLYTLDQLNTTLACGTGAFMVYAMVSIPGQGPNSGIEWLFNPVATTYAVGGQTSWATTMPFVLMPDGIGGYIPYKSL